MPLLLYACRDCGEEREFLLGAGESPDEDCSCGTGRWTRRMPRRVGISFKGGGFYATDARGGGKKAAKTEPAKKDKGGDG